MQHINRKRYVNKHEIKTGDYRLLDIVIRQIYGSLFSNICIQASIKALDNSTYFYLTVPNREEFFKIKFHITLQLFQTHYEIKTKVIKKIMVSMKNAYNFLRVIFTLQFDSITKKPYPFFIFLIIQIFSTRDDFFLQKLLLSLSNYFFNFHSNLTKSTRVIYHCIKLL